MKLNRIWIVRDPSPISELEDILYETTVTAMANYVIGTGSSRWAKENHAIYTEEGEARKDAEKRLAKEQKPATIYRPGMGDTEPHYTYDRGGQKRRVTIPGR